MDADLDRWGEALMRYTKEREDAIPKLRELARVPSAGSPVERLTAFQRVWQALEISDGISNPLSVRAAKHIERAAGIGHEAESRYREILGHIEAGILKALKEGAQVKGEELVLSCKWPIGSLLFMEGHSTILVGGPMYAIGRNDSLWGLLKARSWQADDFFQLGGPILILGPANLGTTGKNPRGFYTLASAMSLTRQKRKEQLETERAEEVAKRERDRAEEAILQRSPEWRLQDARRRLAALEEPLRSAATIAEQEAALEADPMLRRYRALEQHAEQHRGTEQKTTTRRLVDEAVKRAADAKE